MDTGSFL